MDDLIDLPPIEGFWYLGSPYSKYPDGTTAAFVAVCIATGWLIGQGVRVYSPIAHTHPVAMHAHMDPLDHEIWMPADEPMMDAAGGLLILKLDTWRDSKGLQIEEQTFRAAGKPVVYVDWPRPPLFEDDGWTMDETIMAMTIYGEARNQDIVGKEAVAWVIRNRSTSRSTMWPDKPWAVCLQPFQFSAWNTKDVNLRKMVDRGAAGEIPEDFYFLARKVLRAPKSEDPTLGATHYHTRSVRPGWAAHLRLTAELGSHLFYR